MLLLTDSRLDDGSVEGVGDQGDDKIVLGDLSVEGLVVGDIEGDGGGVLDALGELLSRGKSTAGCCTQAQMSAQIVHITVGGCRTIATVSFNSTVDIPTVTGMPASLRTSRVGRVTKPAPSMRTLLKMGDT